MRKIITYFRDHWQETILLVFLCLYDYTFAHLDELWAKFSATKQFNIYDINIGMRLLSLIVQVLFLTILNYRGYRIKPHWITITLYILYWIFAAYEFNEFINSQQKQINDLKHTPGVA